jgi:hypothetical protein
MSNEHFNVPERAKRERKSQSVKRICDSGLSDTRRKSTAFNGFSPVFAAPQRVSKGRHIDTVV